MTKNAHWLSLVTSGLMLSACASEPPAPEPAPEPTETPTASESEPVSIIREDVDVGQEALKLQPLEARISFDDGGYDLSETAIGELEAAIETRQFATGGAIVLRGHTDSVGNDRANLRASQLRAEAVRNWLIERGVAESRLTVIAMGEQDQARPNAKPDGTPDEMGRAFNRRVDLTVMVPAELAEQNPEDEEPTLVEQVSGEG